MNIKPVSKVAEEAFIRLKKYQTGKFTPVVTGREWLDDIFGGLIPGDIVTIGAASGGGKTFELQRIRNVVMNKNFNPNAGNFVWLDNSLEMRFMSLMLRDLKRVMGKSKKKILLHEFTEEEKQLCRDYNSSLNDGRFFINEETDSAESFETGVRAFLEEHRDKDGVFISIDHIALQKAKTDGKKNVIDDIIDCINRLKKEFPNSYWIILSQLNRNILLRNKERDSSAQPDRGDFYQSDTIFHVSDYVYVTHNPFRHKINEFMRVNPDTYSYLSEHFTKEEKGKVSFKTFARVFYFVLKSREAEVVFNDIFIEEIEFEGKEEMRKFEDVQPDLNDFPDLNFPLVGEELPNPFEK